MVFAVVQWPYTNWVDQTFIVPILDAVKWYCQFNTWIQIITPGFDIWFAYLIWMQIAGFQGQSVQYGYNLYACGLLTQLLQGNV